MKKIIIVEDCGMCPYQKHKVVEFEPVSGIDIKDEIKCTCEIDGRVIFDSYKDSHNPITNKNKLREIPNWCPLKDYIEKI